MVLWWEKSPKKTGDFVIPAKAGIQSYFELFDFKAKHWTPTFVGVTAPRGFYCKVGISIFFHHPVRPGKSG